MKRFLFAGLLSVAACAGAGEGAGNGDNGGGGSPADAGEPCPVGGTRCDERMYQECRDGLWADVESCDYPRLCFAELGCTACDPNRAATCVDNDVYECLADGTIGEQLASCGLEACADGVCLDECGAAAQRKSYLGCEYWPVDLDNAIDLYGAPIGDSCDLYGSTSSDINFEIITVDTCQPGLSVANNGGLCNPGGDCSDAGGGVCAAQTLCALDAQHAPFAIVVANPDAFDAVTVTLENSIGTTYTTTIEPGAVSSIYPQEVGFADQSVDHSGIGALAYRLTSSHPIVAYQFNPLDNEGLFSNDGSLLIPVHTFGTTHYAASWPSQLRRPYSHDTNSFVTVVASAPGTTTVTVTSSANVRAGNGVSPMAAGVATTFVLARFDTLNLEAVAEGDLTGTLVTSDKPVGVFAGHEAIALGETSPAPCCMDHIEEQVLPTEAWGSDYVVVRLQSRGLDERDIVRVVAYAPNTIVSFDPPVASCPVLGPGDFCQIAIDADVHVTANESVLVAHYMTSAGGATPNAADPALSFAVPVEQYRHEYALLVPQEYNENYFGLVAPTGSTVRIDGVDVSDQLTAFGVGDYVAGRVPVEPGQRLVTCDEGCSVEIYGWSDAVSYLFAGGLDLEQITIP